MLSGSHCYANQKTGHILICAVSLLPAAMYDFLMCAGWCERAHPCPPTHVLLYWLKGFIQRRHQLLRQAGKPQKLFDVRRIIKNTKFTRRR